MPKVYFSHATSQNEVIEVLERMYEKLSQDFDVRNKRVAIKTHFGEKGNKTHLNPAFAEKICELVRERGGRPELVECNTLYHGERMRTETHLSLAKAHGFDFAPVVICDAKGKDWEIPVKGKHFRKVKVGGLLKAYDMMIAVTHCKGHATAGYGGAFKNVGMGLGSRAGKLEMHAKVRPLFDHGRCKACGLCVRSCPADAIVLDKYAVMDSAKCIGCATCIAVCPYHAVKIPWFNTTAQEIQERIVEYALGITQKIKTVYFNFLVNITPHCDCLADSGRPMVKDIGVLASEDIASIEQASIDMIIKKAGKDVFMETNKIDVLVQPAYAEAMGMGNRNYEIVVV